MAAPQNTLETFKFGVSDIHSCDSGDKVASQELFREEILKGKEFHSGDVC